MASELTHLEAIKKALEIANRPLSSKEIYDVIREHNLADVSGATPWKTLAARLAQDIVNENQNSAFKRTFSGRYSLREWDYEPEFIVKRRKLNPLEETIKAVPTYKFLHLLGNLHSGLYRINISEILSSSIDVIRSTAEARSDLVQIIPTFVIEDSENIVSYKRTKRLPESRLHYSVCLNFGGHLQSDDIPSLFLNDEATLHTFMYRELFEEIEFSEGLLQIEFEGVLYLTGSEFERQHAGIIYRVSVEDTAKAISLEPGMHTDLRKVPKREALNKLNSYDSWSSHLAESLFGNNKRG